MIQLHRNNYIFLLLGLCSFLLLLPIAQELKPDSHHLFLELAFFTTLVISVWSLAASKLWYRLGWALTALSLLLTLLAHRTGGGIYSLGLNLTLTIFCMVSLTIVLRDIFQDGEVNDNRLVGSICAYLLLGIIWAEFYFFIDFVSPKSFSGVTVAEGAGVQDFLYYSYVTLTTLGYGDIQPIKPVSRMFSVFEAIVGVLYIAILVARLVSAHFTQKAKE